MCDQVCISHRYPANMYSVSYSDTTYGYRVRVRRQSIAKQNSKTDMIRQHDVTFICPDYLVWECSFWFIFGKSSNYEHKTNRNNPATQRAVVPDEQIRMPPGSYKNESFRTSRTRNMAEGRPRQRSG